MMYSIFSINSILAISAVSFFILSCTNDDEDLVETKMTTSKNYAVIGDSLSTISQHTLLMNVGREMQSGGPVQAVDFCNLNASKLMDSLSNTYNVIISRVTSKPRNSSNMATDFEFELLQSFEFSGSKDTLINYKDKVTYYKPIKLGMSTCLKCHGTPGEDINEETLKAIEKRYPKDLAKNYSLGDFRGAWKIQFQD